MLSGVLFTQQQEILKIGIMFGHTQFNCISLFFISVAASSVLQHRVLDTTNAYLLNLEIPESDITTLPLTTSLDMSWPAASSLTIKTNDSNTPASVVPASNVTEIKTAPSVLIKCDGTQYGFDLSIPSCREAFELLPQTDQRRTCKSLFLVLGPHQQQIALLA